MAGGERPVKPGDRRFSPKAGREEKEKAEAEAARQGGLFAFRAGKQGHRRPGKIAGVLTQTAEYCAER
ncbi:hypothetical protein GCM10009414_30060 [Tatumella terrea]